GLRCENDVNECAVDNGGCGPANDSVCTNTFGDWNCTGFIVPGSLYSIDDVQQSNPLILGSLNGQHIRMLVTGYRQDFSGFGITVGAWTCSGLLQLFPIVDVDQLIECNMPSGWGADFPVTLRKSGVAVYSTSVADGDSVSYPAPVILPNTLCRND